MPLVSRPTAVPCSFLLPGEDLIITNYILAKNKDSGGICVGGLPTEPVDTMLRPAERQGRDGAVGSSAQGAWY